MEKTKFTSTDEYIASFPEDVQELLQKIRSVIREAAPEAKEVISYNMPTYRQKEALVHFAAYKSHIGFYPAPSPITAFAEELAGYKRAKGSVQFPLTEPIPFELIRAMTEYRVRQVSES
ncbi:iron chaperone [Tellurirhabdus rosea]|uniref:iron chaperone n=1 Tax=Tellurirhabdus rosea TaxID=2674997 RepID=UPI002257AF04|nr:DUF1801 domain-containing protein [Tellurirhabdus rosea]